MIRGQSLLARSLRRILRSPPAVASAALLALMAILALAAPLVAPLGPTEMRPWLGALGPGASAPAAIAGQSLAVGKQAEVHPALADSRTLEFTLREEAAGQYRLLLREDRLARMQRLDDLAELEDLDLAAPGCRPATVPLPGRRPVDLAPARLRLGDAPPAGWFQPGERVIFVSTDSGRRATVLATLAADGTVASLRKDNREVAALRFSGGEVARVAAGGAEVRLSFLLGTDELGRDMLARVLSGGRISLMVGLLATAVSILIGVLYGALAGYAGGGLDRLLMAGVDVLYAVPFMFLVILLLFLFGRDIIVLFVALGAVEWLTTARIVRGQVLTIRQLEYIEAARACGSPPAAILCRHVIPNTAGPVMVCATLTVPAVILEESFLSFIGLSVQHQGRNLDSWGALVQQGVQALGPHGEKAWILLAPSAAMALTLLALNILGDGLRDAFDPQAGDRR